MMSPYCNTLKEVSVKLRTYLSAERPMNLDELRNVADVVDEAVALGNQLVFNIPKTDFKGQAQLLWMKLKILVGCTH